MEQVYNPAQPTAVRKEKVVFPDGRFVWAWGLTASAFTLIQARAARHPNDPRGGSDMGLMVLCQIVSSCYAGEEDGSARIFSDLDLDKAGKLTAVEMTAVLNAINRVNGQDATETEVARDFLAASEALTSSPSTSTA